MFYIMHKVGNFFLEKVISSEVKKCIDPVTLFRGSGLGITAFRYYVEFVGKVYILLLSQ